MAPPKLLRTREKQLQAGKISACNRQLLDFFRSENGRHVSAIRLELRNLVRAYFDGYIGPTGCKRGSDLYRCIRKEVDTLLLIALETTRVNLDVIDVRDQVLYGEIAGAIGLHRDRSALRLVRHCNGCAWNCRSRSVCDGPED